MSSLNFTSIQRNKNQSHSGIAWQTKSNHYSNDSSKMGDDIWALYDLCDQISFNDSLFIFICTMHSVHNVNASLYQLSFCVVIHTHSNIIKFEKKDFSLQRVCVCVFHWKWKLKQKLRLKSPNQRKSEKKKQIRKSTTTIYFKIMNEKLRRNKETLNVREHIQIFILLKVFCYCRRLFLSFFEKTTEQ